MYDFETCVNREGTAAIKVDGAMIKERFDLDYFDDTISMWVADMDFACAPEIVEAIKNRADRLIFGYTMPSKDYKDSIINWYKRRHNMNIEPEWIVFSNGTVAAIRNVLYALTEEGDGVIIQPPVYYPFEQQIRETGRKIVNNNLVRNDDNSYSINFDEFEEQCKQPHTKMFIYCNPHNPTGNIWSADETQRLLDICAANNVIVFSDEIHCDLIRSDSEFVSALNLRHSKNLIIATAVNKTFNVAGLHITNLVIENDQYRNKLVSYKGMVDLSPFALETTVAAYNRSEDWVTQLNNVLDENLNYMDEFIKLNLPRIKFVKPQGTYLTWLDFSDYGMKGSDLLKKIASEAHLILEDGIIFGECGEGFIRMNIACPKTVLIEALDRLKRVFG
ncbi:MAG: aminotransferase [Epulopiscium sp. Nuni2H_MBin001]|nr:MAG: aminotransferase [Epulopiscium sp. Nuni2H_MBin001]